VVAAEEGGGSDVEALLVGDFFRADEARGVTGACGGDGGIERVSKGVAESDARRAGFDEFAGARAIKHARLCSHDGSSLYTGGRGKKVESRELKANTKAEIRNSKFEKLESPNEIMRQEKRDSQEWLSHENAIN
jgi:hypothetical protein